MEFDHTSVLIQQPFRLMCAGASGVGKSWFVKDFIEHVDRIVDGVVDSIIYCYSEDQPLYHELSKTTPGITWIEGFDENIDQYLQDTNKKKLLVIDDQMCEGATSSYLLSLFTKRSHHSNTSIIFITQNIFFQGKYCRTISLNSTCFCVFKNPRDQRQISTLASQICPWNINFLREIYCDATKLPYSYLFIDLRPDLVELLRYRTDILSRRPVVYVEKTWQQK
jgi:hypothetical protein